MRNKITVTQHAVERLDERAYLKYFWGFKPGENKQKYLMRFAAQALRLGRQIRSETDLHYWYKGIRLVFKLDGKNYSLITLWVSKTKPKKSRCLVAGGA